MRERVGRRKPATLSLAPNDKIGDSCGTGPSPMAAGWHRDPCSSAKLGVVGTGYSGAACRSSSDNDHLIRKCPHQIFFFVAPTKDVHRGTRVVPPWD